MRVSGGWTRLSLRLGVTSVLASAIPWTLMTLGERYLEIPEAGVAVLAFIALGALAIAIAGLATGVVALTREGPRALLGVGASMLAFVPPVASAVLAYVAIAQFS